MGCCLSSSIKTSQKQPGNQKSDVTRVVDHHHFRQRNPAPEPDQTHVSKTHVVSPHPPVVEEESVKEVLSETPISKPPTPEILLLTQEKKTHLPPKLETEAKKLSEASQIPEACECEVSESFSYLSSTTTTTITEVKEEDEAMSKRKREAGPRVVKGSAGTTRRKRPNSGELAGRRGRGGGRAGPMSSPASKPERSVEKRNRIDQSKSVGGRESSQTRTRQRNGGYAGGVRGDIGELSSRRSRSPAPRSADGVSRGGLARNASRGTGRAGGRSMGEEDVAESGGKNEEDRNDGVSQLGNESLENPLVALECFIFV